MQVHNNAIVEPVIYFVETRYQEFRNSEPNSSLVAF